MLSCELPRNWVPQGKMQITEHVKAADKAFLKKLFWLQSKFPLGSDGSRPSTGDAVKKN